MGEREKERESKTEGGREKEGEEGEEGERRERRASLQSKTSKPSHPHPRRQMMYPMVSQESSFPMISDAIE